MFADDTILFSYTKEGLQKLLNNLNVYCDQWNITVNVDKTVAMVFKQGNVLDSSKLFFNNKQLINVKTFTYLGVTLSSNGQFFQAQKKLSKQALKALFSLNSLFEQISFNINEKLKLFDTMILPILNYGAEVWGFHKAPNVEKVYLKFLKQVLNVKQQTTNATVYGELGRITLDIYRKERILKYWYKINKSPNTLMHKVLKEQIDINQNYDSNKCWSTQLKAMLNELGLNYLWNNEALTNIQIERAIERLHDQYYQNWYSTLNTSPKLETYNIIKTNYNVEKYIDCVTNMKHRLALTRFRCSAHNLAIEEGRYRNIPRENRICTFCNMNFIETEYHFLLVCPYYREIRSDCLPNYYCSWPSIHKLKSIMCSNQTSILKRVAKYIYIANQKREFSVVNID